MAEHSVTNGDWLSIQQKYWDVWLGLTHQSLAGPTVSRPSAADAWSDNLARTWESMSALAPPLTQDFFARLLDVSRLYFRMGEMFVPGATRAHGFAADRWIENIGKAMQPRDALAFWDLPLDTWRRTVSTMLPLPGDFLQAIHNEDMARVTALRERIDRFLSIPAVGYSREAQEQYQRFMRLLLDYWRAVFDYNAGFLRAAMHTHGRLIDKIETQPAPVDSLRKLYDLWVDACEEAYGEYTMSEEYARLYGRLINALVAVKSEGSLLVDEALEAMNMPTRREINTMHQRVRDMQRINHALRADLDLLSDRLEAQARTLAALQQAGSEPSEVSR